MRIAFPNGYTVRLNVKDTRIYSTRDISPQKCVTPGCARMFNRQIYNWGGEKEYHSGQCAREHREIKRRAKCETS